MTSHQSVPPGERPPDAPDAAPLDAGPEREPLLRPAMFQDDDDPAWAWWLPLPGLAVAIVWAAYQAVSADSDSGGTFLRQLAWPGAAALALTTIAAYFGWRLDLD